MALAILLCVLSMGTQLALGILVLARAPGNRVNQVFALLLFLFFWWSLGELLLIYLPSDPFLVKLLFTPVGLLPYVFAWFVAIFPKRWEAAPILQKGPVEAAILLPVGILLALLWTDRLIANLEPIENGFLLAFGPLEFLAKGIVVGYLLLALHALSEVWKRADSEFQQRRLRYTFAALALPGTAGPVFMALGRWYLSGYSAYTFGLFPVLGLVMSCMLAYAILRYNLLEIDLIFSVGLVYTLLTAILAGVLELMENMLQNLLNLSSGWTTIVSTLFIAALFSPMKDLLVSLVDRFFGKRTFDAAAVLRHLLQSMRKGASAPEVLEALLRESAPVLGFSEAAIRLRSGLVLTAPLHEGSPAPEPLPDLPDQWLPFEDLDAIIEAGQETAGFASQPFKTWRERGFRLTFPIRRGETVEGALFLGAKEGSLPYTSQEKSLMASVCEEVVPVLDNLALLESMVARDRVSQEIDWARQMYSRIQADSRRSMLGGYEILLFSSLAREIKGDLIDLQDRPGDCFITVHDAFHHGILAALTLHLLYSAWRCSPPEERLERAHAVLRGFSDPPLRSAITHLEVGDREIRLTNAGNPPPLLFTPGEGLREAAGVGKPLGLEEVLASSSARIDLQEGGFLFCCTNGLSKTFGTDTGHELVRFLERFAPDGMPACHQALQNRLASLPDRAGFPDDITYVFLRKGADRQAARAGRQEKSQ